MPVVVRRLLVVLAVAGAGFVPAPAMAAGYCTGSGVSVVVDFGALGGGIQKGCDSSGNRNAATAFENTGHPLSYATRQPGFVCRVNGVPASDPCYNTSPSDAYWGLYWSDGTSGWTYSSLGAGSLNVPAGATVAFSWQNGGTADPPGAAPAAPAAAVPTAKATPTRTPTATATARPKSTPAGSPAAAAAGSASAGPSRAATSTPTTSSATAGPTPSAGATTTAGATETPSAAGASSSPDAASEVRAPTVASAPADSKGGLPWWVPVAVLIALAAGGGTAWWTRRRAAGGAGQST